MIILLRLIFITIIVLSGIDSAAQNINYFKVNMGAKFENYRVTGNPNVNPLLHMDVGAGLIMGKRFTPNLFAEVGILKNDYSSKFEVTSQNLDGEELKSFSNQLYPTHSTSQISAMGGYRHDFNEAWAVYGQLGLNFFLTKKLDREGSQFFTETASNAKSGYEEQIDLITYSNGFETGNIIFRADIGFYRRISEYFSIDINISKRASNLPITEYEIEYYTSSEPNVKKAIFQNSGSSFGIYLGLKYIVNDL